MDRHRQTPLDPKTADRLARNFRSLGAQYPIFAEVSSVSNGTINQFLDTAEAVDQIRDLALRSDTAGMLQSLIGLWQIFSRQGSIAPADQDRTLAAILTRFAKVKNEGDVFDGGRDGVQTLLAATGSPAGTSGAGSHARPAGRNLAARHLRYAQPIGGRYDSGSSRAQRLISLASIFDLVDQLEHVAKGEKANNALITKTAARISGDPAPPQLARRLRSKLAQFWILGSPEKHIRS